jgi:hypothetical protein
VYQTNRLIGKWLALHQNFTSGFTRSSLPLCRCLRLSPDEPAISPAKEKKMRTILGKFISCAGALVLAFAMTPGALAQCGLPTKAIKPMDWHPQYGAAHPSLVRVGLGENEPSIIGMWHVIFTAQTSNGESIPGGGSVIDNSVVVWHGDGTEIMNSSRAAQDGNFCLGVWERIGERSYYLNHIPWQGNVYDPSVPADTIGPTQDGVQLTEKITLSPDGNSYSGTFTLHAYDNTGSVYQTFTGGLSAKRITISTSFTDLLN